MKIEKDYILVPPGTELNIKFDKASIPGTLKIGNQIFNVYLSEMNIVSITDRIKPELEKLVHKFVLIEA